MRRLAGARQRAEAAAWPPLKRRSDARLRTDRGLGLVALVLGLASLVPVYGIAAAPFAVFTGLAGRRESRLAAVGLGLGLAGCVENALVLLLWLL